MLSENAFPVSDYFLIGIFIWECLLKMLFQNAYTVKKHFSEAFSCRNASEMPHVEMVIFDHYDHFDHFDNL